MISDLNLLVCSKTMLWHTKGLAQCELQLIVYLSIFLRAFSNKIRKFNIQLKQEMKRLEDVLLWPYQTMYIVHHSTFVLPFYNIWYRFQWCFYHLHKRSIKLCMILCFNAFSVASPFIFSLKKSVCQSKQDFCIKGLFFYPYIYFLDHLNCIYNINCLIVWSHIKFPQLGSSQICPYKAKDYHLSLSHTKTKIFIYSLPPQKVPFWKNNKNFS